LGFPNPENIGTLSGKPKGFGKTMPKPTDSVARLEGIKLRAFPGPAAYAASSPPVTA
jgi:hypothetical protein